MSATFLISSSQRFDSVGANHVYPSPPVPAVMGCWFYPTSVAVTSMVIGLYSSGTTSTGIKIWQSTTSINASSNAAGTQVNAASGLTLVANRWYFAIARFITITNRWISALDSVTGATSHVQNTTSNSPSTLTRFDIGGSGNSTPNEFFGGNIAEVWFATADIQRNLTAATALDDGFFRQIAYQGPFSHPEVANNLVTYQSLLKVDDVEDSTEQGDWKVQGQVGIESLGFTNPNNAVTGPHPLLATTYIRPGQNKTILPI